jgi:carboxylate-amine ligase
MKNEFNFGLEAEFMLADSKTFKPLWYKDVTFKTLDELFSQISLDGIPSLTGLAAEPPHHKLMPFIVEGYGIPDANMNIIDAYPKGIEIRTPVCNSIHETMNVYEDLYLRVRKALSTISMVPVAISHHPTETKFSGPQNKRRHDYWLWAMEVMTTYGPDINISLPDELSRQVFKDLDELNAIVNYYAPSMAALSLASPFYEGKPWMIKGREGKSYRTFKRSVIAPAIELHPDENNRIEFKVFEMTKDSRDFEAYFHLVLGLFLSQNLKGRASHQERIYDSGHVAQSGLNTAGVKETLSELFSQCEIVLPQYGFKTDSLKRLHVRLEKREHISDKMLEIYHQNKNIHQVVEHYSNFLGMNGTSLYPL